MKNLKKDNVNKCFSLLREFIEETGSVDNKKGIAILALDQLHKITAGEGETDDPPAVPESTCIEKPLVR
ncbi:MAG: hypothetical protein KAW12_02415 [Candidatus Aminicenantes bacterium]|nr:hypothetical protein [Candidatus Aminicenantes bacterium]